MSYYFDIAGTIISGDNDHVIRISLEDLKSQISPDEYTG